jgi:hypothetical protein
MFERANLLRTSILKDLEVLTLEVGYRPALAVQHPDIHRNQRNAAAEGARHLRLLPVKTCDDYRQPGDCERSHQRKL